jgi:hypothetical protein
MKDMKESTSSKVKMDLLQHLRKMAMQMINDGHGDGEVPGHMESVQVAAKDKAGLAEGLDKAKEIVGRDAHGSLSKIPGVEGVNDEMASEPDDALEETSEEDPAALKAEIEKLKAELAKHGK